jgi:acyl-ACP thioesterase
MMTEDFYSRREELIFRDCDARGRVRLGTLLSLLASTAGHDFDARGLDFRRLYQLRQVFLLSRLTLHIARRPMTGEILTAATWENGFRGVHVRRDYEFTDSRGKCCAAARSEWIIIDPADRKIVRPEEFTGKKLTTGAREIDCPACRRVVLPRSGLAELGVRTVRYSDLDYNGHVYSGNYGDIFWDALPPELQNAEPEDFTINYNREATLGDRIRLTGGFADGVFLAGGACADAPCFTCACTFRSESPEEERL